MEKDTYLDSLSGFLLQFHNFVKPAFLFWLLYHAFFSFSKPSMSIPAAEPIRMAAA